MGRGGCWEGSGCFGAREACAAWAGQRAAGEACAPPYPDGAVTHPVDVVPDVEHLRPAAYAHHFVEVGVVAALWGEGAKRLARVPFP